MENKLTKTRQWHWREGEISLKYYYYCMLIKKKLIS